MKLGIRYITMGLITVLLLVGLMLQLPVWRKERGRMADGRGLPAVSEKSLAIRLPATLSGGSVRDEPIAASEEMKKAVGELLNYNDGLFRIYQLPDARVSVYVAWWEAGRMSPRLVATHTPDVCWPGNGWVRDLTAEGADRTTEGGGRRTVGGGQLTEDAGRRTAGGQRTLLDELRTNGFVDGECRVFRMQTKPEYVVFWHKVGDEMLSYKTGHAPPWWAWIDEMWRGGLNLRKEQLFVRISSDKPLESVWGRSELEPLRAALLELGLRVK